MVEIYKLGIDRLGINIAIFLPRYKTHVFLSVLFHYEEVFLYIFWISNDTLSTMQETLWNVQFSLTVCTFLCSAALFFYHAVLLSLCVFEQFI